MRLECSLQQLEDPLYYRLRTDATFLHCKMYRINCSYCDNDEVDVAFKEFIKERNKKMRN